MRVLLLLVAALVAAAALGDERPPPIFISDDDAEPVEAAGDGTPIFISDDDAEPVEAAGDGTPIFISDDDAEPVELQAPWPATVMGADVPAGFFATPLAAVVQEVEVEVELSGSFRASRQDGTQVLYASFEVALPADELENVQRPAARRVAAAVEGRVAVQRIGGWRVMCGGEELGPDRAFLHHVNVLGSTLRNEVAGASDERRPWGTNVPLGSRLVHALLPAELRSSAQVNVFGSEPPACGISLRYRIAYIPKHLLPADTVFLHSLAIQGYASRTALGPGVSTMRNPTLSLERSSADSAAAAEAAVDAHAVPLSELQQAVHNGALLGSLSQLRGAVIVHAQGHMHVGGQRVELRLRDEVVCRSNVAYAAGPDRFCRIECPTQCMPDSPLDLLRYPRLATISDCLVHVPVAEPTELSVHAFYDARCSFPLVEYYFYLQVYWPHESAADASA